jgi:hypothetical protein
MAITCVCLKIDLCGASSFEICKCSYRKFVSLNEFDDRGFVAPESRLKSRSGAVFVEVLESERLADTPATLMPSEARDKDVPI